MKGPRRATEAIKTTANSANRVITRGIRKLDLTGQSECG
jgi:hypothetical protein